MTQKLIRTEEPHCTITYFEKVLSKRPSEMKFGGLLYLTPLRRARDWSQEKVWFSRQPVGVNIINNFTSRMVSVAGLDVAKKHFTIHSMRKTTVRKLKKAGVCSRDIMAITGHRNDQSLADYDQLDLEEYREISNVVIDLTLPHPPPPACSSPNHT